MKRLICVLILPGLLCCERAAGAASVFPITQFGATADDATLDTAAIQQAIDACAAAGGGTVRIPKGRFLSGGLRLKENIRLLFDKDAVLQGSDNCREYGGEPKWTDALLKGENLRNLRIEGSGRINSGLKAVLRARDGNVITRERVTCQPANANPYSVERVNAIDAKPAK